MKYAAEFEKWWASLLGLKPSEEAKPIAWLGWKAALQHTKDKQEKEDKRKQADLDNLRWF